MAPITKKLEHDDLRRSFLEGESCDKDIFAEQRTNILLVAGDHYNKKKSKFYERLRDAKGVSDEQKLRLTKNHTYKIMRSYSNAVSSFCPDVMPTPSDEKSLQDVKAAELHHKVQKYAKQKHRMKEKKRDWADDYTIIGEVATKIFFDPMEGKQVGWQPETDEDGNPVPETDESGNPVMDEQGNPQLKQSEVPVYSGDFVFEKIYGFNLIRAKEAKAFDESPLVHIRKMVEIPKMQARYVDDKKKQKMFTVSPDETMIVFDAQKGAYGPADNQCMVVESYARPCPAYPQGYYWMWTMEGIFEEGALPFGVWPIAYAPFDKYQTSPRGRSHIKVLRPFQAEINRAASKMAEHQVTLGDDKVITQAGTEVTQGAVLPGIRGYKVSGAPPTILPGRDGSQYLGYMQAQILEMYKASLVEEEMQEQPAQIDPYSLLYRAASQKKKFTIYTERFEQFLADVWTIYLELARHYMPDDELLEAVGHDDQANMSEFRNPQNLGYILKLEPQSEDLESKLGRQLTITQALQYVGNKLDREDIGKLMKNMPYGNFDESFSDLTLDYDSSVNVILSLDRGEYPPMHPADPHPYMIKRLTNRTRKGDFKFLPPNVQQGYQRKIQEHTVAQAQVLKQLQAQEADMIPTDGPLITCDFYLPTPTAEDPTKSARARLPYNALQWLVKRIENQGTTMATLEQLNQRNLADIGRAAGLGQHPQGQPQYPAGPSQPQPTPQGAPAPSFA